jgi:prepilin-type N-terminal cleavage/methylation domain-containing protein|tara:strand:+ start:274 stop:921 length:648 start_codon:yes stop_codon:yes gene_type:complete
MSSREFKVSSHNGFTLIEVLVAAVLTSIMMVGLSTLWTVVAKQFFDLTTRQKAIFVLNGEMERLAVLFYWNPRTDIATASNGYADYGGYSDPNRWMYRADQAQLNSFVTADGATFEPGPNSAPNFRLYFHDSNGIPGTEDRNYVWVDHERNITGRLSWQDTAFGNADCYLTTECRVVTLYLEYPFRYESDSVPSAQTMGPLRQLSLKTIVGRRGS